MLKWRLNWRFWHDYNFQQNCLHFHRIALSYEYHLSTCKIARCNRSFNQGELLGFTRFCMILLNQCTSCNINFLFEYSNRQCHSLLFPENRTHKCPWILFRCRTCLILNELLYQVYCPFLKAARVMYFFIFTKSYINVEHTRFILNNSL